LAGKGISLKRRGLINLEAKKEMNSQPPTINGGQQTRIKERPIIELVDVSCGYDHSLVFEKVDLNIYQGQFAGIVGPTGSGKTTLLKVILGLVKPLHGTVTILGQPVQGKAPPFIGYVPQLESVDWDFPVTVEQVVLMGRYREMGVLPWPNSRDRQLVSELLERLGLTAYAKRQIRNLSGGQQQRVFLARALIGNPKLILLDEPTAGVDLKTQHDILHLLAEVNLKGVTILLTTHDLNAIAAHLPWVICFNQRVIAQGAPEEIFTTEVLRQTYNSEMMVIKQGSLTLIANSALVLKSHE
jgi:zinc/manganese transport system ATP-binding protein/zinc transport system ATP-binding protein